jgi:hypothetical protein
MRAKQIFSFISLQSLYSVYCINMTVRTAHPSCYSTKTDYPSWFSQGGLFPFPVLFIPGRLKLSYFELSKMIQSLNAHSSVGYATGYWNQEIRKLWVLSEKLTQLLRENEYTFQWKRKFSKAPTNWCCDQNSDFWKY